MTEKRDSILGRGRPHAALLDRILKWIPLSSCSLAHVRVDRNELLFSFPFFSFSTRASRSMSLKVVVVVVVVLLLLLVTYSK